MLELLEQERIYLLRRRHLVILQLTLLPLFFDFLIIIIVMLFLFAEKVTWPSVFVESYPQLFNVNLKFLLIFLLSLVIPLLWVASFFLITQYYLTFWVITNKRVIAVKLISLFNVKYEFFSLDKIQDITIFVKGMLPSLFHFGDLRIQTAGEKGQFLMNGIPDPEIVKQVIFEACIDYQKENYDKRSY